MDGYVIKSMLGQGGMGAVFEGEKAGASYALKFITSTDSRAVKRFEREAHAAAAVDSHRHIVSIHKYAVWQGFPYVVMDFVPGVSLSDKLGKGKKAFTTKQSFELVGKMADALHLVHSKDILHRDIKPANILLRKEDNEPLLTDFGLAFVREAQTLTKTAEVLGTPHYMAPEQASSDRDRLSAGTDIWALGVILYELLTGERPFSGQTLVEISAAILLMDPDPPSKKNPELSTGMDAVVLKCLEKNPKARYQSAKDLAADCQAVFEGGPITASRSGLFGRAGRRLLRKTGGLGATVLGLSILVLILGPVLWFTFARQDRLDESVALELNTQFETLKKSARDLHAQFPAHFAHHTLRYRQESLRENKQDPLCKKVEHYLQSFKDFEQKAIENLGTNPESLENLVGQKELRRLNVQKLVMEILESEKIPSSTIVNKSRISRILKKVLKAYLALRAGKLVDAERGFDQVASSVKNYSQLGKLGLAVVRVRQGDAEAASAIFQSLLNDPNLNAQVRVAFLAQSEERALNALFRNDIDLKKTETALLALDRFFSSADMSSDEAWKAWNEKLQRRFKESQKDFADDHRKRKIAYLKLLALENKFPLIVKPTLNSETHILLGNHFRNKEKTSDALYHYLEAQLQDESFDLPDGFRENDVAMLMVQTFVKKAQNQEKALSSLFDIILQASRARTFYPIVRGEWLDELHRNGHLARAVAKYPNEPYPRFWRGRRDISPNLSKRERRKELNRIIDDLSFAISKPELPLSFRSIAIRTRIDRYFDMGPPTAEQKAKFFKELGRLSENWDPKPDQIWGCYVKVKGFEGGVGLIRSYLLKQRAWLKERKVRSEESRLGEGRPKGAGLAPLFIQDYQQHLGDTFDIEANLLMYHSRYKEALVVLRKQQRRGDMEEAVHRLTRLGNCLLALKDRDGLKTFMEKYKKRHNSDFLRMKAKIKRFLAD